mmetsp:Transcript_12301/g.29450  ORF Transcript_12301/g.29450 Transcript_12301/m.29450 type:complete len:352 (-) Transcript_12301:464-1519(-)
MQAGGRALGLHPVVAFARLLLGCRLRLPIDVSLGNLLQCQRPQLVELLLDLVVLPLEPRWRGGEALVGPRVLGQQLSRRRAIDVGGDLLAAHPALGPISLELLEGVVSSVLDALWHLCLLDGDLAVRTPDDLHGDRLGAGRHLLERHDPRVLEGRGSVHPPVGRPLEQPLHEVDGCGGVGDGVEGPVDLLVHDLLDDGVGAQAVEWIPPVQHQIDQHAQRPHVRLEVVLSAYEFWREVVRRSADLVEVLALLEPGGHAEVDHLEWRGLCPVEEEEVLCLDVAVDDAQAVDVVQGAQHLPAQDAGVPLRELLALDDLLEQLAAVTLLHHGIQKHLIFVEVEELDDVLVVDLL